MKDQVTPFDLFAAHALSGILANTYTDRCNSGNQGAVGFVEDAEHLAGAMMDARAARRAAVTFGEFQFERVKGVPGDVAKACGRDVDHWALIAPSGKRAATVWDNGTWHTWDEDGVGMENATSEDARAAKLEAYRSVLAQAAHGYGPLVKDKEQK